MINPQWWYLHHAYKSVKILYTKQGFECAAVEVVRLVKEGYLSVPQAENILYDIFGETIEKLFAKKK
jgi:hypothetical protein